MGARQRLLTVDLARLGDGTVMRLEAGVPWIDPRSPREVVPAAVREIDVRNGHMTRTVTTPAKVARIVRWFDALPVSPPGVAVPCPLALGPDVTVSFRNARDETLAVASLPPSFAWICSSIAFSIGGKAQQPLVDRPHHPSFVRRLQQLLGLHLLRTRRQPPCPPKG
jgi:hypothetical protein